MNDFFSHEVNTDSTTGLIERRGAFYRLMPRYHDPLFNMLGYIPVFEQGSDANGIRFTRLWFHGEGDVFAFRLAYRSHFIREAS